MSRLHVRGRGLPDDEPVQWWIVDGTLFEEPVKDAETIFDGGWILPGSLKMPNSNSNRSPALIGWPVRVLVVVVCCWTRA